MWVLILVLNGFSSQGQAIDHIEGFSSEASCVKVAQEIKRKSLNPEWLTYTCAFAPQLK